MSGDFGPQLIDRCDTAAKLFRKRVIELPDKVAVREKDFGIWNEYSWREYGEWVRHCGLGLKALGMQRGDVCSIAAEICKEWLFADPGFDVERHVLHGADAAETELEVACGQQGHRTRSVLR